MSFDHDKTIQQGENTESSSDVHLQKTDALQPRSVILVEDNPADAELAKLAFKSFHFSEKIIHCASGDNLFKLLETTSLNEVCYILLDLNMPKLSGIDILRLMAVHPNWNKLPVIVFSSSTNIEEVTACYESGANAYVPKPLDFSRYCDSINATHKFWCRINIAPVMDS